MKEIELKIRIYGDKCLRKKSAPVKMVGSEEKALLERMAEIMYSNAGIGLAAPQVGINKQIIILDVGQGLFKLINPKVKEKKGFASIEEGCLSLPGVSVKVKRAKEVFVEGIDEFNKKVAFWADDLFSIALQHEIDHLKGKLIIDYANFLKKIKIKRALKTKCREAGEWESVQTKKLI
ncbi:peptide deformylase [bacterium]|nr:peptide deformylase [bacterium]